MAEREKVIDILGACGTDDCDNCPLNGDERCSGFVGIPVEVLMDAISLLREQEPRVLEYSEIEKHPLVWLEDNDKEDVIPALFLQYNGWNAEFLRQAPDEYVSSLVRSATVYAVEKAYGMMWRAWTSRPTPEQMRETKWEGDSDAE